MELGKVWVRTIKIMRDKEIKKKKNKPILSDALVYKVGIQEGNCLKCLKS